MRFSLLILSIATAVSVFAESAKVELNPEAQSLLDETGYRGTILIYSPVKETFYASHPEIADERFIPASTFKIFSTQAALQAGVIASNKSIIKWDGIHRGRKETNRDLDFTTAFQISAVPHYQGLVREIGAERMQAFIDSVPYGNQDISGGIDQFWLTGKLRISPREQIEFLNRLYRNELPFDPRVMQSVKEMLVMPKESGNSYSAKTGWAVLPQNRNIGWWVGWAERHGELLFFATVIDSNSPQRNFGKTRIETTKAALEVVFDKLARDEE